MIADFARDHDILGASILFTLAAACYVYHWVQLRREANLEPLPDPIAVAIAFHASLLDHDRCDECGQTICRCEGSELTGQACPDTIALGCAHGRSLCTVCNGACGECLVEMRDLGVLSQQSTSYGWWTR